MHHATTARDAGYRPSNEVDQTPPAPAPRDAPTPQAEAWAAEVLNDLELAGVLQLDDEELRVLLSTGC